MPEITKPLYVQYTGNKFRENCCSECRKLLDEDGFVIDRKGEFFTKINENGIGKSGNKTIVKYTLGDCSPYCSGHCYYVTEIETGVEFIYKNIDGEMCDQDPPFSEDDPITDQRSAEERLMSLKDRLKDLLERLQELYENLDSIKKNMIDNREKYNKHLEFKRLLSLQTQDPQSIARNKAIINKEIVDLQKQFNETGDVQLQEILKQKLDFLRDLLTSKNNFTDITEMINSKYADNFNIIKFPNAASKKGKEFDPIIRGSIYAYTHDGQGLSTNKIIQEFKIDTAGASPTSGTRPVTILSVDNSTGHYITSGTYNNVTGIVDFTWNIEPEIIENLPELGQVTYQVRCRKILVNEDEYAVQLDLANPTGKNPNNSADIRGTFLHFLKKLNDNKEDMFEIRGDIKKTEGDIIKTELELSIKNNILSTLDKNTFDDAINTISEYARYIKNALARNRQ